MASAFDTAVDLLPPSPPSIMESWFFDGGYFIGALSTSVEMAIVGGIVGCLAGLCLTSSNWRYGFLIGAGTGFIMDVLLTTAGNSSLINQLLK